MTDMQNKMFGYKNLCLFLSYEIKGSRVLSPVTVSTASGRPAIHQLPSVIASSKPKIFMATPSQVLVNGPTGATLTNGTTHLEITKDNGEG